MNKFENNGEYFLPFPISHGSTHQFPTWSANYLGSKKGNWIENTFFFTEFLNFKSIMREGSIL